MTKIGEGTVLAGYRLERQLGRGGMGAVWLATQEALDRKVALKLLAPEISADPRFRARFLSESRLAASIDHPNIVPVFEAGEADGELFLAMRYVEGTDLDSLITVEGALAPDRAIGLLAGIADALDAAHARGLVHRDVKPSNVLVAPGLRGEHAYLSDFGLTKRLGSSDALTRTGQVIGSVGYLAPEAIEGSSVDHRADIYSLGCVLYAALSGHPPYERDTDLAVLWAHVRAEPPTLAAEHPTLAPLDPVIARALAKDPEARFASAGELLDTAGGALGLAVTAPVARSPGTSAGHGAPSVAGPEPTAAIAPGIRGRRSLGMAAAGVLGAILVGAVLVQGGLLGGIGSSPSPSPDQGAAVGTEAASSSAVAAASGERILYEVRAPRYFDAITDCVVDGATAETPARIWSVDPAKGEQVRVTGLTDLLEHQPVWSKDGRSLTFAASPPEFGVGLWQADSNGTEVTSIVPTDGGPWLGPAIADDGRLAFVQPNDSIVSTANANGTGAIRVPLAFPTIGSGDEKETPQWRARRVAWLPDGRLGVVAGIGDGAGAIWTVRPDGTGLTRIDGPSEVISADWSPDGRRIVYSSGSAADRSADIWIAEADGSDAIQLTGADGDDVDPTWSPDGRRIAFASTRDGSYEIHAMALDGSGRQRLTSTKPPQFACAPSWGRTDAAPVPTPTPEGLPALERGWLELGMYRSDIFRPKLELEVGAGWTVDVHKVDALDLYRPGLDLSLGLVQAVFPGGCLVDEQGGFIDEGELAPATARGLIEWFQALPGLKVSAPKAISVGGESGLKIDIEAIEAPPCHAGSDGPYRRRIGLFALAGENSQLRVPGKARLVVVDVRGVPLTFLYQGDDRLFDSVLDPIVESIEFPED
jgi:Protein kinase domain/WD40-like Beta Propeller Repeat